MIRVLTRWLARRHPRDAVRGIIRSGTAEVYDDTKLWCDPALIDAAEWES